MSGYLDIILVVLFAGCAFTSFTKKEMLGQKKQKKYTKESREKFAMVGAGIYAFLALFCAFYALCNHGIIGIDFNLWLFYGIFLVVGVVGIFVSEKVILKKTDEASISGKAGKSKDDEEEDF